MDFLMAFTSGFNLPFDVWNSNSYAFHLLRIDFYGQYLWFRDDPQIKSE